MRILELKNKLGLFEHPYKDADEEKEKQVILCEEHRRLAREAARKSFVLLKNEENILPLNKNEKTAYIGPYVNSRNLMGSWSIIGEAKDVKTIEEMLKQEDLAEHAVFAQGSPMHWHRCGSGRIYRGNTDVFEHTGGRGTDAGRGSKGSSRSQKSSTLYR